MKAKTILTLSVAAIVLIGGSVAASYALLKPKAIEKLFLSAESHHIREVVRADGIIKPAESVDLSFERSGRISRVFKHVGDTVKAGETVMELENGTEATLVEQARALLQQRQAGFSAADIDIYRAAVDAAKADLDKTKTDAQATVATAQSAVEIAQNNLKLASGGDQSQIVGQAYESAVATMQAGYPQMDNAIIQADSVLGIDHLSAFANYRLSVLDDSKLVIANNLYASAKVQVQATRDMLAPLSSASDHDTIESAIVNGKTTIATLTQLLGSVSDVVKATPAGSVSDQTTLSGMQSSIQLTRTALSTLSGQYVAIKQAIDNAKNSLNAYTIAYNKAQQDLLNAQASTASLVRLKEAAYQQAVANLASKTQPVRETDLAPLRASLDAAAVAYGKTMLKSPIDGIISKQDGKAGAIISPNLPIISVINERSFQLEAFIAETDLAKIKVGNAAEITTDAYGSGVVFPASVISIDPNVSTANGQTGYKVTMQFAKNDDRIKSGMTGNVTIVSLEKDAAVALPERSILRKNGFYEVLVQAGNGQTKEQTVEVGSQGSDGWREIVSGLQAGDRVEDFGG